MYVYMHLHMEAGYSISDKFLRMRELEVCVIEICDMNITATVVYAHNSYLNILQRVCVRRNVVIIKHASLSFINRH